MAGRASRVGDQRECGGFLSAASGTTGIQIINQRRIWKTFPEEVDVSPDGVVVYRQRYYGQFASALDLRDFPLDRHRFGLQLVIPGYGPEEIEFVPKHRGLRRGTIARDDGARLVESAHSSCAPLPTQSFPGGREIAGLEGVFEARRHLGFYIGKAFVSVAIIVFMSWVVFWLGPEHVGPRLSVSVTSMLTLVAYRFLLGQSLPPVSYLTRLDYFLLGSTILVFVALIQVALTSAMTEVRSCRQGGNRSIGTRGGFFPCRVRPSSHGVLAH